MNFAPLTSVLTVPIGIGNGSTVMNSEIIDLLDNNIAEGNITFMISIDPNPSVYNIGSLSAAEVTIVDNDLGK